jgi:hypothetical protein
MTNGQNQSLALKAPSSLRPAGLTRGEAIQSRRRPPAIAVLRPSGSKSTGFTQVGIMGFFVELSVGWRAPPFSLGEKVAGDSPPDEGFAPKAHCLDSTFGGCL